MSQTIEDIYGTNSKFLKAADLQGKKPVLTIESAVIQENTYNGETKKQIVLHFAETEKVLGLNKTNARRISGLIQTESFEDWQGWKIRLYVDQTELDGKTVDCIRIFPDLPDQPNLEKVSTQAPADDDIPF